MAAIAVITNLPISSMNVMDIAKEYGVDHREVMTEVSDMLCAGQDFMKEMEG